MNNSLFKFKVNNNKKHKINNIQHYIIYIKISKLVNY